MTNEQELKAAVTTAKAAQTKAKNSLAEAIANDGDVGKAAAEFSKAERVTAKAIEALESLSKQEFLDAMASNRETLNVALHSEALSSAMDGLRRAGVKKIVVEIESEGVYTISTSTGQRGRVAGTSTGPRESYEVSGIPFTAGELVKKLGPAMKNYDERMAQIASKDLTRKAFAREILEAQVDSEGNKTGTIVNKSDD